MSEIALENEVLLAQFDAETGAIRRLVCKATGWTVQRRAELARSFEMLLPLPGRRNNAIRGRDQAAPESVRSKDGQGVTFLWRGLRSAHGGGHDIEFRQEALLSEDGLRFTATVTNRSQHVLETVGFPCLGDLSRPEGCRKLLRRNLDYGGWLPHELYPRFRSDRGYHGVDYPTQMVAAPHTPFVLIDAGRQGLYAGYHNASAACMVQFMLTLKPGFTHGGIFLGAVPPGDDLDGEPVRLELAAVHYPFVAPGESAKIGPILLRPYVGSWHVGADVYKRWRATWHVPAPTPAWAREVHSWQQIHINSPEDELRCRYRDLPQYGRDCAAHGVKAIQLVGWTRGGQDRDNPSHDSDPRLGTWRELRDAIAEIQAMGVKVVLFSKFTWADRSTPRFREELVRHAVKDPYGDYQVHPGYQYQTPTQLADINTRRLVPMCFNDAAWRQVACEEFGKVIDLGAAGMLYDECQHHTPATYCFDAAHGHRVPACVFEGDAALAEEFRRVAADRKAEFLFAGEACYDLQLRHYSVLYTRIDADHVPLHRYVDDRAGIMVAVVGYDDRLTVNQALLYRYILSYEPRNFKGRLGEFPRTLEYGKRMDALRRRHAECLWDGEFRDTLGAAVELRDGNGPVRHTVFRGRTGGKRAVVLANFNAAGPAEAVVTLDPPGGRLEVASPEQPNRRPSDGVVSLAAASAAVLFEA